MLRPGTSAVFLLVDRVTPEEVASALSAFGGTMAVTPLRRETAEELQDALQGRVRIGD
jgi:uncharacterized membrane protein